MTDPDFAAAMRILQLIVTIPKDRDYQSVPSGDLRCLGRVLTAQQESIVALEGALRRYGVHEDACESGTLVSLDMDGDYKPCTCGLRTLLSLQ